MMRAPALQGSQGLSQVGLSKYDLGVQPYFWQLGRTFTREKLYTVNPKLMKESPELILHNIRQGTHHEEVRLIALSLIKRGDQSSQATVLTLCKRCLDAAARK
jgi:hypothetical protein